MADTRLETILDEYIKRKDALDWIQEGKSDIESHQRIFITAMDGMNYAAMGVSEVPAADVEPVKHGRWKDAERHGIVTYSKAYSQCSVCDNVQFLGKEMTYCPSCGARMDKEEER